MKNTETMQHVPLALKRAHAELVLPCNPLAALLHESGPKVACRAHMSNTKHMQIAGEEEKSDSDETEEEEQPAKRPSRNARRKKHKRQLRRLGLLSKGMPAGAPSSQAKQQPAAPSRNASDQEDEHSREDKRRKPEEHQAR